MNYPRKTHILFHMVLSICLATLSMRPAMVFAQPETQPNTTGSFFVHNNGQFDTPVRYALEGSQSRIWLNNDGIWITWIANYAEVIHSQSSDAIFEGVNLRITFPGSNTHAIMQPLGPTSPHINYILGEKTFDSRGWKEIVYADLYPGIDLIIEAVSAENGGDLISWRLNAEPGANLDQVRLQVAGADKLQVEDDGLRIGTRGGSLWLPLIEVSDSHMERLINTPPKASRLANGVFDVETPLRDAAVHRPGNYQLSPGDLVYSTFLGGSAWEVGNGIALGEDGSIYIAGRTASVNFPTTPGAFDSNLGQVDAYIARVNANGDGLIFATYLGGAGTDGAYDIAVDGSLVYITGITQSQDFPTTDEAFDTTCGSDGLCNAGTQGPFTDAFLAVLNSDGSQLEYSTYLGGRNDDSAFGVVVDAGKTWLTGITYSTDFPAMGYTGNGDVFAVSFDSSYQFLTATLLGGSDIDAGFDITVLESGIYITGETSSIDFPAQNYQGGKEVFLVQLDQEGSPVTTSLVGGTGDESAKSITGDTHGNLVLIGSTTSTDLPATAGMYSGNVDALVVVADPAGEVIWLSYLGGSGIDDGRGITSATNGSFWLTGFSTSTDFPTTPDAFQPDPGGQGDAFATHLDPYTNPNEPVVYSTYLGGEKRENGQAVIHAQSNQVYITGYTQSGDFPLSTANLSDTLNGIQDIFVTSLVPGGFSLPAPTAVPTTQPAAPGNTTPPTAAPIRDASTPGATVATTLVSTTSGTTEALATSQPPRTPTQMAAPGTQAAPALTDTTSTQTAGTVVSEALLETAAGMNTPSSASPSSLPGGSPENSTWAWIPSLFLLAAAGAAGWFIYRKRRVG